MFRRGCRASICVQARGLQIEKPARDRYTGVWLDAYGILDLTQQAYNFQYPTTRT